MMDGPEPGGLRGRGRRSDGFPVQAAQAVDRPELLGLSPAGRSALVLGLMLWFIWANNEPVTVAFPFRLGQLTSTVGVVILLSALVGSVATGS